MPRDDNQAGITEFTRIKHNIIEALCRQNLTARQYKVVLAICRKTYGWHQSKDYITASQIALILDYKGNPTHISADIRALKKRQILNVKGRQIGVNKHVHQWLGKAEAEVAASNENDQKTGGRRSSNVTENGHKSDRNQSGQELHKVTGNSHKCDRNRSGHEVVNVTGIGSPSDRNQSQKVTGIGQHKRKEILYQEIITNAAAATRIVRKDSDELDAVSLTIKIPMSLDWRPSYDLLETLLQGFEVAIDDLSKNMQSDLTEFLVFWSCERSGVQYSAAMWHQKLAERLSICHQRRLIAEPKGAWLDQATDRGWASGVDQDRQTALPNDAAGCVE